MKAPNREPLPHEASAPLQIPELPARVRAATQELAEAFCDQPDFVAGTRVRPITPATFSMLVATGNAFAVGGQIRECDVRNFIWFHHPWHCDCTAFAWRLRKWLALDRLVTFFRRPVHRLLGVCRTPHRYSICMALVSDQIETLVDQAFATSVSGDGALRVPIASLEAYLVHRFAKGYGWEPERTRHTPLRQLFQLERCLLQAQGVKVRDRVEEELLFRHIAARNAAIAAQRAAAAGGHHG